MMWTKPWNMKEGFLIGGGLIIAGLALELSVGPIIWEAFAWPANGMVLAGFLLMIAMMFLFRKKVYAFQFVGTYQAAIPAMVYAVVLAIRAYLCVYHRDSGCHHPTSSDALKFMETRPALSIESSRSFHCIEHSHTRQCRHAAGKDDLRRR